MQRYFGTIENDILTLSEDDIFHMSKVMKMNIGEEFEVVASHRLFLYRIVSFNPFYAHKEKEIDQVVELNNDITLIYSPAKGDKIDLVIQKATEIGVREIVINISARTIVRFDKKSLSKKLERFSKIAKEASEQSKRLVIPLINKVIDFDKLDALPSFDHKFIMDTDDSLNSEEFIKALDNIKSRESVALMIGPEGGFTPEEVKRVNKLGYQSVSLGKRILRNETAAICASFVTALLLEKL